MVGLTNLPLLCVDHLIQRFGGVPAVNDVSFEVAEGQIVGLIGPNGAGKTTTFNLISGQFPPSSGKVRLRDRTLTGLSPDKVAMCGVARTFQGTRVFSKLTVEQNVMTAVLARIAIGFWSDWLATTEARRARNAAQVTTFDILKWIGLETKLNETAASLPHAHQSMLGIGLALASKPTLLLLDEPFAGMNPGETRRGSEMVRRIRDQGITIVLVEHDMAAVMDVCDRIIVLDHGVVIAEGRPDEVRRNRAVIEAYLGTDEDA
jgi:branched-chain amino acid transport system ATP-binding protein